MALESMVNTNLIFNPKLHKNEVSYSTSLCIHTCKNLWQCRIWSHF